MPFLDVSDIYSYALPRCIRYLRNYKLCVTPPTLMEVCWYGALNVAICLNFSTGL